MFSCHTWIFGIFLIDHDALSGKMILLRAGGSMDWRGEGIIGKPLRSILSKSRHDVKDPGP